MCARVKSDMCIEEGQRHRGDGQSRLDFCCRTAQIPALSDFRQGCRRLRRRSTKFGCQFPSPAEHHAGFAAGTLPSLRRSNASANYFEWLQADLCIGLIFAHRRAPVLELRYWHEIAVTIRADLCCWPCFQGRKTARPPSHGADEVRFSLNIKTAKALRLTISEQLLALADEVIE